MLKALIVDDEELEPDRPKGPGAILAAAVGGGLALLQTGDQVRIDLNTRQANILISDEELASRQKAVDDVLSEKGRLDYVPDHQTPWQEIQRGMVDQFEEGMVLKPATKYRDVGKIVPRDNH